MYFRPVEVVAEGRKWRNLSSKCLIREMCWRAEGLEDE